MRKIHFTKLLLGLTLLLTGALSAEIYEIPYMPRGDDPEHQGFIRITNMSDLSAVVDVWGVGDDGEFSFVAQFTLFAGATKGFRISELENGDISKGLTGSIGTGVGDWRILFLSSSALRVVGFYRNPNTGFLNSLHDTAHAGIGGAFHILPTVNPGSNPDQLGKIRLTNPSGLPTTAYISGVDDNGIRFPSEGYAVEINLVARGSITLSMAEIEQGSINPAVIGALGDGYGKWRLLIESNRAIGVMSLIFAPGGYISNVTSFGEYTMNEGGRFPITCATLDGAVIMSYTVTPTFLGFFGSIGSEDSIFNDVGAYGSSSSLTSIFNPFSQWGSASNTRSAFDDTATSPPLIIKHGKVLSFLSTNTSTIPLGLAISPNAIMSACPSFTSDAAESIHNPRDFAKEPSGAKAGNIDDIIQLKSLDIFTNSSSDTQREQLQQLNTPQ